MTTESPADVRALTATDQVVCGIYPGTVSAGPGTGTRVLGLTPAGGIHVRVLLDRGMDIGAAWYCGDLVSWLSAHGEQGLPPLDEADGWHDGWGGGLITTCGLRNVGRPSEGHGRHGTYTALRAEEVSVRRAEGSAPVVSVRGVLRDSAVLGRELLLTRTIVADGSRRMLTISDQLENQASYALQCPILYHVNLGYPFLDARSVVQLRNEASSRQRGAPMAMGHPADVPDAIGEWHPAEGAAKIASGRLGRTLVIRWSIDTLPRLFVWQRRTPGSYVMAIEPANCGIDGRLADRERGDAPFLQPGDRRLTEVSVAIE